MSAYTNLVDHQCDQYFLGRELEQQATQATNDDTSGR